MADRCLKNASIQGTLNHFIALVLLLSLAGCGDSVLPESHNRQHHERIELTHVVDPGENNRFQPPDKVLQADDVPPRDLRQNPPIKGKPDAYHGSKTKKKKDFAKLNGSIFVDWKKPKAAILLSGMLDGYVEPCGCAGLENQKGGLNRRMDLVEKLKAKGWPLAAVDLGGMVRRFGPQAAIKYQVAIDAHRALGYEAIGLGARDLQLASETLLSQLTPDGKSPFISANIQSIFDEDFGLTSRYRVLTVGGVRIGVTQVLGEQYAEDLQNADYEYESPETALHPILDRLKDENCDLLLLLANTTVEEAQALGETFADFDYVVVAGDSDPPPPEPESIGKGVQLIELGHKGMYVGVIGVYANPTDIRYQRVPLDGRFEDTDAITRIFTAYQDQLRTLGLAGLALQANAHPSGREFVGSETCADCHSDAYEIWENSPHSHATETLINLPLGRQHDPECISCHVTGWEPQEYYPFTTGYENQEKTPHLFGNGCENCHGGGAAHVAAENGDLDVDDEELERLRSQMHVSLQQAKKNTCVRCHDLDNSPEFEFETYWPQVAH